MTSAPCRLLILDDEDRIRQHLLDFFDDYGEFSLRDCGSGEAALEELAREPAELCIVDMRLPGMDGQAFVLAALERRLCRQFVLHTGSMDFVLDDALKAYGLTDHDVFLKPYNMGDMLARIRVKLDLPGD